MPPVSGRLIDGRELRVESDGVHIGERLHPLSRMQEARLLFRRPETIGLRMSDIGQVEYSFARAGDGVAALEALCRLRPELRREDAPAPEEQAPPSYFAPIPAPEATPFGAPFAPSAAGTPYSAPPMGFPPRPAPTAARPAVPVPFPQQTLEAYGAQPNKRHPELTPLPRNAGQLIGSAFRLFGKWLGPLLALALLVGALPMSLLALADAILTKLSGSDPLAPVPNPWNTLQDVLNGHTPIATTPATNAPVTGLDAMIGLVGLLVAVFSLLAVGWAYAALTIAAREAALGRQVRVWVCARAGLSRAWATIIALFWLYALVGILLIPGLALALAFVLAPNTPNSGVQSTQADVTGFAVVAGLIAAMTLMGAAYVWTRFALYPTAAALGLPRPLRTTLLLTTFGWWRVFVSLAVVTLFAGVFTLAADASQLVSVALGTVLLAPLAQFIAGPLSALIRVGVLYDQRLRREGFALFTQEGVVTPPAPSSAPAPEHGSEVLR